MSDGDSSRHVGVIGLAVMGENLALNIERNVLVYTRVPYDNETAARKVRDAGLPAILSHRLIEGA